MKDSQMLHDVLGTKIHPSPNVHFLKETIYASKLLKWVTCNLLTPSCLWIVMFNSLLIWHIYAMNLFFQENLSMSILQRLSKCFHICKIHG